MKYFFVTQIIKVKGFFVLLSSSMFFLGVYSLSCYYLGDTCCLQCSCRTYRSKMDQRHGHKVLITWKQNGNVPPTLPSKRIESNYDMWHMHWNHYILLAQVSLCESSIKKQN